MNHITVTGGDGFIGSRVIWWLKLLGEKPVSLDKKSGFDILTKQLHETDTIIHLAANLFDKFHENLEMTRLVCKSPCKKVVFTSSAAVYGNGYNLTEVDDLYPYGQYGRMKAEEEKMLVKSGKKVTILRLANVYGYGTDHGVIHRFMTGKDTINGDGKQDRDFIWVEDVARAIVNATLTDNFPGIYNISSGIPVNVRQLAWQMTKKEPDHGPAVKEIRHSSLNPYKAITAGIYRINVPGTVVLPYSPLSGDKK